MTEVEMAGDALVMDGQARPLERSRAREAWSDASLVEAVRRGDREAFGQLYDLYAPMVHGILLGRVPWREVDDLVQDVFLSALRGLETLRNGSSFGPWLAAIARNSANDYHRRTRIVEEELTDVMAQPRSTEMDGNAVLAIIRKMPETYRESLILRLVEGMTGPEIAARTGLTPASVRVNLHRGMKILREKLGMEVR